MIKLKMSAIKTETDNMHTIFLLKKNVRSDIIKTILGYLPIMVLELFKQWKVAITSVRQGYEFTKGRQDYQIRSEIIYRGRETLMDIWKSKDNYNKNKKLRYFNCNAYRHIAKDCRKLKKKKRLESVINVTK